MTLIFLIILFIITIIYNTYIIIKNKNVPESISETSYIFHRLNGKYYLFTCYCFLVTIILLPIWLNFSNEDYQFLVFLSCSGILFAGITAFFKEDFQKTIHYTSGIIAVITYIIWLILSGFINLLIIEILLVLILIILNRKNYVYYTEIVGLIGLIFLLIFNNIK